MSVWVALVLGTLSVWRLTHLLNAEDGPGDIFVRLRRLAGPGLVGQLLDCFYCLSLWMAAPFALVLSSEWRYRVLLWLSCSGGACLLERWTERTQEPLPPPYREDPARRNDDGLLWKGTK